MQRSASAHWSGNVSNGQGTIATETGALHDVPYCFKSRFEDGPGTNPEELLAAAHAVCFSMALALGLGDAGLVVESVDTNAVVTLDKDGGDLSITAVHLVCSAKVPGANAATFAHIAQEARRQCPLSRALNVTITLEATLEH